jgi:hypothetical protein
VCPFLFLLVARTRIISRTVFCAFRFCFACEIGGYYQLGEFLDEARKVAIYLGEMGELRSSLKYFPRVFQLKVSAEFQASIEMHSENVKCTCKSSIIEIRLCDFI